MTDKYRKEAKRFKRKYLELERAFDLIERDILDLADADAYNDYQFGFCFGLLKAGEIVFKHRYENEKKREVWSNAKVHTENN